MRNCCEFGNPLVGLASVIHHGKGQYALLLGSGVSSGSAVKTGWGVAIALARQLPDSPGAITDEEVARWFESTYGMPLTYSHVVESLAPSRADRHNLLRRFFEPTDEERENGIKVPSQAHRAVAELIRSGTIRVIITTNFDRLLEQALFEAGVAPSVVYNEKLIESSVPYAHSNCTVLKVNGDYLDSDFLNTAEELGTYPEALRVYLGRLFQDFGLIVCGWSGDYDFALANEIIANHNARYTTYWLHRSQLSEKAREIGRQREAKFIEIESADHAFQQLSGFVAALQTMPLEGQDEAVMTASVKRYLPRPECRVQLDDLISSECQATMGRCKLIEAGYYPAGIGAGEDHFHAYRKRVWEYDVACSTLTSMTLALGYYGNKTATDLFVKLLARVSTNFGSNYGSIEAHLRNYPAALLWSAFGTGSIANNNLENAARLLRATISKDWPHEEPIGQDLNIGEILSHERADFLFAENYKSVPKLYSGAEDHVITVLSKCAKHLFLTEAEVGSAFDGFGYLWQLTLWDWSKQHGEEPHVPYLREWRISSQESWRKSPEAKLFDRLRADKQNALIQMGFFGGDFAAFESRALKLNAELLKRGQSNSFG